MKNGINMILALSLILTLPSQYLLSQPITLVIPSGESVELEIKENDPFLSVINQIQTHFSIHGLADGEMQTDTNLMDNFQLNFALSETGIIVRSKKKWRDFHESVDQDSKTDINYIVTTLANESIFTIGKNRSSLKKAGERIKPLHPFCFLITIFNNEKLKAGVHAIRDRGGWVWSGFIDGLVDSLKEEAVHQNLLQYTKEFSQKIKINEALIETPLEQGKWKDFVNILIDKIPRKNNPNHYDM